MTDDSDGLPDLLEAPPTQEVQDLLEAYRAQTHRSGAQVESALQSVTAHVGAASATAAATTGISTTAKVGLAATLLGVVGVVGLAVGRPSPQPEPRLKPVVVSAPAAADLVDEVEPEPVEREVSPAPEPPPEEDTSNAQLPEPKPKPRSGSKVRIKPKPKPKALPSKPAPTSTLTEELRRLQQVRAALRGGTPARARALIQSHRRDYPNSTLAQERDATEVAALCAEDRDADAKRKAAAFAKAYPGSSQDLLADCDG